MAIDVFDFFSGCGGASKGFESAGLKPVFALDFDKSSAETFTRNFPNVQFGNFDISQFDDSCLRKLMKSENHSLFCGCAPCQPFTRQNTKKPDRDTDKRRSLVDYLGVLIETHLPDYIFMENVPGMKSTLLQFAERIRMLGYESVLGIIKSQHYGVPQCRKRLVLLASGHGKIGFPEITHGLEQDKPLVTVRETIGHFPAIKAGETHCCIANHRAADLSELNLRRIMATPSQGSRMDWPEYLHLACHARSGYSGHTDVYGRMKWDSPATGLTTRCTSLSNGRFGHPEQHRAISIREAAALQTFPDDFVFHGSLASQARQIGNAVPVLLAKAFGTRILAHSAQALHKPEIFNSNPCFPTETRTIPPLVKSP